jgi:hypothetical protein
MIKTTNPYSGESIDLTEDEHKVYMQVKQDEVDEKYDSMQKGLSKFSKMNAKAYFGITRLTTIGCGDALRGRRFAANGS